MSGEAREAGGHGHRAGRRTLLLAVAVIVGLVVVGLLVLPSDTPVPPGVESASPARSSSGVDDRTSSAAAVPPTGVEPAPSPEVPAVDPDVPAERVLYCDIQAAQVRNLLAPDGEVKDPSVALRDAVPLLRDRLSEWRSGAQGLSGSNEELGIVQEVLDNWEVALGAYDTGDTVAAESALAEAERRLVALEASLAGGPASGC